MLRRKWCCLVLIAPVLVVACGGAGSTVTPPPPPGSPPPAPPPPPSVTMSKASSPGDLQAAEPGTALAQPVSVVIRQNGSPLGGEIVIWQPTSGSVKPTQSISAADGTASTVWTLGAATGLQGMLAFLGNTAGTPLEFAAFGAVVVSGTQVEVDLFTAGGARFEPAAIIIAAGTTVTWVWKDGAHNVAAVGTPTFTDSPLTTSPPRSFQFTFATPGTYHYFCAEHGTPTSGMIGAVIVR